MSGTNFLVEIAKLSKKRILGILKWEHGLSVVLVLTFTLCAKSKVTARQGQNVWHRVSNPSDG